MEPAPAREPALQQLSAVPGVVGSMVFRSSGAVISSFFPPIFDVAGLHQLASQLADDKYFQDWLADEKALLDLRYADGRVMIRSMQGSWLLVLCTADANSQLLSMSLTQAIRRLRATRAAGPARAPAADAAAPSPLERLRAIASAELGKHATQALEILAVVGPRPGDVARAISEIEKMTRLFISKKKADEIGRMMREVLET